LIHLDTHVVAWLWAKDERKLRRIRRVLERNELSVSPMVQLELQALFEIGRTRESGAVVLSGLAERIGLRVSEEPFVNIVQHAANLSWTRDPFDRVIVGNAIAEGVRLLTVDENIQRHLPTAFWP